MNPGSHAFPAAIVNILASRNSFTSRSCNVANARSTRPFVWGLFAQMISMFSADRARPNRVNPFATHCVLAVHPEELCLSLYRASICRISVRVVRPRVGLVDLAIKVFEFRD
jgi:hypothetical protein